MNKARSSRQYFPFRRRLLSVALLFWTIHWSAASDRIAVGAARVEVTPEFPVVLAGYAGRPGEFTGIDTPLFARALAIGDKDPVVLVAIDNCGATAEFGDEVARQLQQSHGMPRESVVVCFTHTHNAPNLTGYAAALWNIRATPEQKEAIDRYTQWLLDKTVALAREALRNRRPATLEFGQGRVYFGGNRRVLREGRWAGFGFQQDGPVDHSLPVLAARDSSGKLTALWTTYASHCTTLGSVNRIHFDWAGHASEEIEKANPGAVALTTIGCGADVGPQPSGSGEYALKHGQEIAAEVKRLLEQKLRLLNTAPTARRKEMALPLQAPPSEEELQRRAQRDDYTGYNARLHLQTLEEKGSLAREVPCSITSWVFGEQLAMVFLNGEVGVDYAVRLKRELDWPRLWIHGWANDVPGYIVSKRVLSEGGYEPVDSMLYYEKPAPFAPEIEDLLVSAVKGLLPKEFARAENTPAPDFLKLPPPQVMRSRYLRAQFSGPLDEKQRAALDEVRRLAAESRAGFGRVLSENVEESDWFSLTGQMSRRPFIRQMQKGAELRWAPAEPLRGGTLVFAGGTGWESQPQTEGFVLLINNRESIRFDVSRQPARWSGEDGKVALHFFPTWTSHEDAMGLYYLVVPEGMKVETLSVQSLGEGSQRWFGLETISDVKAFEAELLKAAGSGS